MTRTLAVGGLTFGVPAVVDALGSRWTLTSIGGWDDSGSGVRRDSADRPQRHGAFAAPGFRTGRLVAFGGLVECPSRAIAADVKSALAALLADGSDADLTVVDVDEPTMSASVGLASLPVIDWTGGREVECAFEMWAPDPLRYAAPVVSPTGFAQLLGGLEFDLFTDGTVPTVRTNLCPNPSAETASTGYLAGNWGTGGAGTLSRVTGSTGAAGSAFVRMAWTTANTAGTPYINAARATGYFAVVVPGQQVTASIWVRANVARTIRPSLITHTTAEGAGWISLGGSSVVVEANTWTRISVTGTPAAGNAWVHLVCEVTGGIMAIGDTFDIDGLLIEQSPTLGTYFDGDTPDVPWTDYAWTGTAHASASTQTVVDEATVTGLLEYGDPGTETGMVDVTNAGTAPAWLVFTVTGPTPAEGFDILVEGDRLRYSAALSTGQTLVIDTKAGTVLLDGADRRTSLTIREWRAVAPGETATVVFTPLGGPTTGQLSVSLASAFW